MKVKKSFWRKGMILLLATVLTLTTWVSSLGVLQQTVSAATSNLVINPGFESSGSELTGWTYSGTDGAWFVKSDNVRAGSGTFASNYYSADPFSFNISQSFTGLADGEYKLKAWAVGGSQDATVRQMYVITNGVKTTHAIGKTAVWNAWESHEMPSITVTSGEATIGLEVVGAPAGEWGYFDDIEFYKVETAPTWSLGKSITASNVGPTSLTLDWSGVEQPETITGYRIYQNDFLLATTLDTSINVTDLLPETTYTFKVQAGNSPDLWSADGPSVTVTTTATTATAPAWGTDSALSATLLTSRGVWLQWPEASDAVSVSKYRIYQNSAVKATVSGSTYGYQATDLVPGTSYTFKVEAGNDASLWSLDGPSVTVQTPQIQSNDFIKGADISTLQAIEDAGGKYYENGVEKDLLAILKDHGVNYVRLRLWNNPIQADGYNDKAHTVEMAKRVKAAGLKLLLDFHYSDFWADPGNQVKPAAWEGLNLEALNEAVYDYTSDVMNTLKAENAYPDMVQIGNEINPGMMLPEGSISNYDKLSQLLGNGINAVRDTTPAGHEVKIMIHLAEGGDNAKFRSFFDALTARNVDYDVIGLSFYPYWHGTFKQLKDNLNDLAARYGKQLIVVETAHPHTLEDGDGWGNIAEAEEAETAGFPATVQGQADAFTMILNTVAHTNNGRGAGAFYWEPAWIPVEKNELGEYQAGWKTKEGNAWDNQAMFDFAGNALSSLNAYRFDVNALPAKAAVKAMNPEGFTVSANEAAADVVARLPATVGVLFNEGSIEQSEVIWQPIEQDRLSRIGEFTVTGTITGTNLSTSLAITVTSFRNLASNAGFEDSSTFTRWTLTDVSGAAKIVNNAGNAHSGQNALNYWYGSDYSFELSQTIEGLQDGLYTLKARVSGEDPDGKHSTAQLYVDSYGGARRTSDPIVNTGWNNWSAYTIENIEVTNGQATIGIEVDAPGEAWGYIDTFEFFKQVTVPEWTSEASLGATEITSNSLKLSWSGIASPTTASAYKIYRNGVLLTTVTGVEKVITGLAADTLYTFKVEASEDSSIWTSSGPSVSVRTLTAQTSQPSGSSTGTGSGGTGPIVNTVQGVVQVKKEELEKSTDGRTTLKLPKGTHEVELPVLASELLSGNELVIENGDLTMTIPASILSQLEESNETGKGHIEIRFQPIAAQEEWIDRASRLSGSKIESFSDVYDFGLNYVSEDGQISKLTSEFKAPITLQFKPIPGTHPNRAGVFYLADDGSIEYVGGVWNDGIISAEVEHFSAYAVLELSRSYSDVPVTYWAYDAIDTLTAKLILSGKGDDQFDPASAVTRAEFAAMLARALKLPVPSDASPFKDVQTDTWYSEAIAASYSSGIVSGRSKTQFQPDATITREEMVVMVMRAYDFLNKWDNANTLLVEDKPFADHDAISSWARLQVQQAQALGFIQGKGNNSFAPEQSAARAEAAQLLYALITR